MSDLIDQESIVQLKALMGDKFPQLVETYVRNADKHVAAISSGYAQKDAAGIVDAAHPLKSSSGNMGLTSLSALAAEIEKVGKTVVAGDEDITVLEERSQTVVSLYAEAKAALLKHLED